MSPSIPSAKLTLSCPLFAADFDPRHHGLLLVGGGGGEGRSGVGNKIALLNTSKRSEISEVVDINLSRDEDSVTSLAAVQADDEAIVALAGINSSVAEQKRGNNQHLRSFRIDHPTRKEKDNNKENEKKTTNNGQTTALSRTSLFRTVKASASSAASPDTYQRTLRLSPWQSDSTSPRVAAIATGLAPAGEIVFFSATPTPSPSDVIGRIRLNSDEEAEDVDLIPLPDNKGQFRVAYTNGIDICICTISADTRSNASPDIQCVYTTPIPDKGSPRMRPKFRALRFLSSTSLLLLQNAPDRKGCELVLLDLRPAIITSAIATAPTKEATTKGAKASILRRKKLRKTIKIGLGLDTCLLSPDPTTNQQQAVIAISGSDQSIELLTLEFNPSTNRYNSFQSYTSLRDVHPFAMTKLCFSRFQSPSLPVSPETPPQYIKLASVSMGNTVVVHTLPLSPCPPTSRSPRYVLSMPGDSEIWTNLTSSFAAILSILTVCFILQAFTEIRGAMPPYLGAKDWLPPSIRDAVAVPYDPFTPSSSSSISSPSSTPVPEVEYPAQIRSLNDILHSSENLQQQQRQSLLINCNPETNTLRIDSTDPSSASETGSGIHTWEDLSEETRHRWISQLTQAGYEPSGEDDDVESLFKGVRFGDLCTEVPIHEEL
ncbi:hypothetical protein CBS63078_6004 [Aspergillus niger]|uniref:Guanine nucleotide-exchange factor SEC12 n=2 Tax=Aspergillus TaxID=5052 RepID=A0A370PD28_ASPPH|nr:uncharacterized protein BO96DRAFT_370347 [Aspergillus niger CBS 101883]KAI2825185.1 hypothetical protein CBS115989_144 [Aspergillus niger]RDH20428.1 hypothetical protein M747DRAFT_295626 [Aspergillus niger ATCC 13496]RDK40099.1 hypothetical protein M752DRAFT_255110 [Aspergillus phoenicis ATCC 13157]KAI2828731.1 hypothetical protein CBS133816_5179 [Aspergillus niger]KAI2842881.1 hypothetical protein CBS11350_5491 [Aspergillus niger]